MHEPLPAQVPLTKSSIARACKLTAASIIVSLASLLWGEAAAGTPESVQFVSLNSNFVHALKTNDIALFNATTPKLITLARAYGPTDARLLRILELAGTKCVDLGQFPSGIAYLKEALIIRAKLPSEKLVELDTADTKSRLAFAETTTGNSAEGARLCREAFDTRARFLPDTHPRQLQELTLLVQACTASTDYNQATRIGSRLLQLKRSLKQSSSSINSTVLMVAFAMDGSGDTVAAEHWLKENLRSDDESDNFEQRVTIEIQRAIFACKHKQEREAGEFLHRALQILNEAPETGKLAMQWNSLADAFWRFGRYQREASECRQHALMLCKKFSLDSGVVAECLLGEHAILVECGKSTLAESTEARLLQCIQSGKQQLSKLYRRLAANWLASPVTSIAEAWFEKNANRFEKLGEQFFYNKTLASLYGQSGKFAQSLQSYERATRVSSTHLPRQELLDISNAQARCEFELGHSAEMLKFAMRAENLARLEFGTDSDQYTPYLISLADAYYLSGSLDPAIQCLNTLCKNLGERSRKEPALVSCLLQRAKLLRLRDQFLEDAADTVHALRLSRQLNMPTWRVYCAQAENAERRQHTREQISNYLKALLEFKLNNKSSIWSSKADELSFYLQLSDLEYRCGKYKQAEQAASKALVLTRAEQRPLQYKDMVTTCTQLMRILRKLGRPTEATLYGKQAVSAAKSCWAADSWRRIDTEQAFARHCLELNQGTIAACDELLAGCAKDQRRFGSLSPLYLTKILDTADCLFAAQQDQRARQLYTNALLIESKLTPRQPLRRADAMVGLAKLDLREHRTPVSAKQQLELALKLREETYLPDSFGVVDILNTIKSYSESVRKNTATHSTKAVIKQQ